MLVSRCRDGGLWNGGLVVVRVLHETIGTENATGEDGHGRLCGPVGGAECGEDNRKSAAHRAEEGL